MVSTLQKLSEKIHLNNDISQKNFSVSVLLGIANLMKGEIMKNETDKDIYKEKH